jgi:hypothetical protein
MKVLNLLQLQVLSRTKVYKNILPAVLKYFTDITSSLPPLYLFASSTIRSPSLSFQSPITFMELLRKNHKLFTTSLTNLISGFHRALLQSVTCISRLMHSVIQNVDVKFYIV